MLCHVSGMHGMHGMHPGSQRNAISLWQPHMIKTLEFKEIEWMVMTLTLSSGLIRLAHMYDMHAGIKQGKHAGMIQALETRDLWA